MLTALLRSGPTRVLALIFVLLFAGMVLPGVARDLPGNLPTQQRQTLPPEARQTLSLIERGGPFPYRKDGTVFQNRERRLPLQTRGYYREYTVPTPGERDRGARRIVAGQPGEYYYTADHYRSFKRVVH